MCNVVSSFVDEHSMTGKPCCAYIKHIHEELRIPTNVLDEAHNTVLIDEVDLDQ